MKQTSSYRNKILTLSRLSAYLCFALILSYLEALLPIGALIPIPGIKLGLANIVVILCFYGESPMGAALVSLCRIIVSALLFGTVSSLFFSLSGGALSFITVLIMALLLRDKISFISISLISAIMHNIGQFICSCIYVGVSASSAILPLLLLGGAVCGFVTGIILCTLPSKIFFRKEFGVL